MRKDIVASGCLKSPFQTFKIFLSVLKNNALSWGNKIIRILEGFVEGRKSTKTNIQIFSVPISTIMWFGDFTIISVLPKPYFFSQQFNCPQKSQHVKPFHEVHPQF